MTIPETIYYAGLVGAWGFLWCGPLTEPGEVFSMARILLSKWVNPKTDIRRAIFKVLIGCGKCHAGQVAFWWQVISWHHGNGFDPAFIIIAITTAILLNRNN